MKRQQDFNTMCRQERKNACAVSHRTTPCVSSGIGLAGAAVPPPPGAHFPLVRFRLLTLCLLCVPTPCVCPQAQQNAMLSHKHGSAEIVRAQRKVRPSHPRSCAHLHIYIYSTGHAHLHPPPRAPPCRKTRRSFSQTRS